jgi:demethylmenaquinone methyltransferase/2-methoxy-6-polyprenyl-1,4-benzoquinol methylase
VPLDHARSLDDYRGLAHRYDRATRRIDAVRRLAVASLQLEPGDSVIDVACGTGFCFAPIVAALGREGTLFAFDQSAALLAQARERIRRAGWTNVVLLESSAEAVDFGPWIAERGASTPTAVLFSYAHDVMQSHAALRNILCQARPGARVAATSTKLWPRALWPASALVNRYLWRTHERYITARDRNFDQPWRLLAGYLTDLRVRVLWPGWRYVAVGRLAGDAAARSANPSGAA